MKHQLPLAFHRTRDYPRPPATYGECAGTRHLRALPPDDPRAVRCQAIGCRYNLTRVIAELPEAQALRIVEQRYKRGVWDTCALDAATEPRTDSETCIMLGDRPHNLDEEVVSILRKLAESGAVEDGR